jgi:hypothetical protein
MAYKRSVGGHPRPNQLADRPDQERSPARHRAPMDFVKTVICCFCLQMNICHPISLEARVFTGMIALTGFYMARLLHGAVNACESNQCQNRVEDESRQMF